MKNLLNSKKAQNTALSYLFYIAISILILIGVFFYSGNLNNEIEIIEEKEELFLQSNTITYLILKSYEQTNTIVSVNQSFDLNINTINKWGTFSNNKASTSHQFQLNFCQNYSTTLQDISKIYVNRTNNCIEFELK